MQTHQRPLRNKKRMEQIADMYRLHYIHGMATAQIADKYEAKKENVVRAICVFKKKLNEQQKKPLTTKPSHRADGKETDNAGCLHGRVQRKEDRGVFRDRHGGLLRNIEHQVFKAET